MNVRSDTVTSATHKIDVTAVGGAGHLGVLLVLALAKPGLQVNRSDLNRTTLDTPAAGRRPSSETGAQVVVKKALAERRPVFTSLVGHVALLINEGLVPHVVHALKGRHDLASMMVGLVGMALNAESDDTRASLSYKFKKALNGSARAVLATDPFVTTDPELRALDEVIANSDVLFLCAPHAVYRETDFKDMPIFDVWSHLEGTNVI